MPKSWISTLVAVLLWLLSTSRAATIGWDSDDFLIGGGPSFTTKIGVFDHDLSFKGFLDGNFIGVQGMDFDRAGHLVAVGELDPNQKVRVYDSSGVRIGGFTTGEDGLGNAHDLKVAPDGSYLIGTGNTSTAVLRFLPDGTFVQQIGSSGFDAVAVVPGNRMWASGITVGDIKVFDLETAMQTGTVSLTGFSGVFSMTYSLLSGTVLVVDGARVHELDLQGNEIRVFNRPPGVGVYGATRGPNGDVFATTGSAQRVLHWNANGEYLGSFTMPVDFGVSGIVWAGNAPEPTSGLILVSSAVPLLRRRPSKARGLRQICW